MFVSKVTVLEQAEHMYLHTAVHKVAQHRECTFKKQIQLKKELCKQV